MEEEEGKVRSFTSRGGGCMIVCIRCCLRDGTSQVWFFDVYSSLLAITILSTPRSFVLILRVRLFVSSHVI